MRKNHYILTNAHIVNVENGEITKGTIEIQYGYIKRIALNEEIQSEAEVIDVQGKYIIPGLIDMHCHINEHFAKQFVAAGVTTVRNPGGQGMKNLENLLNAPIDAPTPRVYAADRLIDGPPGLWGPTNEGNYVTDNPEEAREEVRRQYEAGTKFIKVYGLISKEVLEAVCDEAAKLDLEVSVDLIHAQQVNALDAARLGVTWFEHASGFIQALYPGWYPTADKEEWKHIDFERPDIEHITTLCEKMLKYNVKLCPTLLINDQIHQFPNYWNPNNIVTNSLDSNEGIMAHWQQMEQYEQQLKDQLGFQLTMLKAITKVYFDLGGTVVAGTDTPAGVYSFPGMGLHRELEIFVEMGMTELEALQAATINAAKAISLEEIGVIKEEKIADLVILKENPLVDIKNTKEIFSIVKGGKMYSQEEIL